MNGFEEKAAPNGFEQRTAKIRTKILQTTFALLQNGPYKKLKITDIAKAAGVSQVTIYNYFGSKEVLLREAFKDRAMTSMDEFETFMEAGHSFRETMDYVLRNKQNTYSLVSSSLVEDLIAQDPEISRFIENEYKERAFPLMIRLIERGKQSGEVSSSVSLPVFIAYLQMFISNSKQLLEASKNSGDAEKFNSELTELFFYGLCGKK
ncbi:TetR/AcrR family transcriptional regulator [Paenibacillus physcomitrellae]|uniref:TetR family transcriptional regulator n=1 Tax=Paenibacillus physcomitrellae TaxID=1619311 RepID=A0ABQ1GTC7_9BACL|nr:TetR/AcrR family transcriptional regulator [Paenibacillus physcomitrellae]GGA49450.1 TetR family transcriptional regulator [Paenibacillus physcomitrellae]